METRITQEQERASGVRATGQCPMGTLSSSLTHQLRSRLPLMPQNMDCKGRMWSPAESGNPGLLGQWWTAKGKLAGGLSSPCQSLGVAQAKMVLS